MAVFTVVAPIADYTGLVGGVEFFHGAATVPDTATAELAYFHRKGYKVVSSEPVVSEVRRPGKAETKAVWVAYVAATTGLSEAEAADLTKDELIDLTEEATDGD